MGVRIDKLSGLQEQTWTRVGRANLILDNLLARGEAKPMIVVMLSVLDSGSLSLGTGFLVRAAAKAAAQGRAMEDILSLVREQMQRTHVFAVLDTLEYLRRSGRLNRVMATLGSWLQMKPLLKMHEAKPTAQRSARREAAAQRLLALLKSKCLWKGWLGAHPRPRKRPRPGQASPAPVTRGGDAVGRQYAGLWHTPGTGGGRLCLCQRTKKLEDEEKDKTP